MSDRLREEIDEGLQFYLGKDYEWYKKHRDIDDWIFELVSTHAAAEVDKARRIPDPDRYSRRLKRLKRRRDWLKSQSDSTPDRTDIGYTRAELSALNWAIEILEDLNPHLNTQESEDRDE